MNRMLALIAVLTLSLGASANDADKRVAGCAGDHHGTYVEFKTNSAGKIYLETSNDSDDAAEAWKIVKVTKGLKAVPAVGQSWAIRQAITAANAQDGSYEMVMVEAKRGARTLYVQLNKWQNSESYLSVEGFVEALTCRL